MKYLILLGAFLVTGSAFSSKGCSTKETQDRFYSSKEPDQWKCYTCGYLSGTRAEMASHSSKHVRERKSDEKKAYKQGPRILKVRPGGVEKRGEPQKKKPLYCKTETVRAVCKSLMRFRNCEKLLRKAERKKMIFESVQRGALKK